MDSRYGGRGNNDPGTFVALWIRLLGMPVTLGTRMGACYAVALPATQSDLVHMIRRADVQHQTARPLLLQQALDLATVQVVSAIRQMIVSSLTSCQIISRSLVKSAGCSGRYPLMTAVSCVLDLPPKGVVQTSPSPGNPCSWVKNGDDFGTTP